MDFGIFTMFSTREGSTQSQIFQEWLQLAQVVENAGLDTLWLGESHFRPQRAVLASPLVGAAAVAARTKRIRVGLAVQVLPLANPLRVAEEAAIVDHISEGRLIFGVGRSSFLESYEGYNVDYAESRALFLESLEIIQKAWLEDTFSYTGKYYQFRDVQLVPKPYQKPHPPIRVAVESRETFALAGRLGFPIFIRYQMDVPELQDLPGQGIHRSERRDLADRRVCGRYGRPGTRGARGEHDAPAASGAGGSASGRRPRGVRTAQTPRRGRGALDSPADREGHSEIQVTRGEPTTDQESSGSSA